MLPDLPVAALKYLPNEPRRSSWALRRAATQGLQLDPAGLPVPSDELLVGYADSAALYLADGGRQVELMMGELSAAGVVLPAEARILDFGCGVGRMIRHLGRFANIGEVWGVDISAPHVHWCTLHLQPPFRFATTTTQPHLPFADRYFDFVYAASVFTHIEDLAEAWLLELRRVLRPGGAAYVTIHDDTTTELLRGPYADHWLARQLTADPTYRECAGRFDMLVIGRDLAAQVFYSRSYFSSMAAGAFELLRVAPGIHGYQTAFLLRPQS